MISLVGLISNWIHGIPAGAVTALGFAAVVVVMTIQYHTYRRSSKSARQPYSNIRGRFDKPSTASLELLSRILTDLGSSELSTRMAAIAALEPLAWSANSRSIVETLIRFIRARTHIVGYVGEEKSATKSIENNYDVLAALSVLGRLRVTPLERNAWFDLSFLDLRRCKLRDLDFSGTSFRGTLLDFSDLTRCDLSGCDLTSASLQRLQAVDVSFSRAIMQGANLSDAVLIRPDLTGAILAEAKFTRALVHGARMDDALLPDADLTSVSLSSASAKDAYFSGATFDWASLTDADLRGSNIRKEQLSRAHLEETLVENSDDNGGDSSAASLI